MKRVLVLSILLLTPIISGCATVRGMGKDIESTGQWIQRNVSDDQNNTEKQEVPDKFAEKFERSSSEK